jgi:hypothetical protein
MPWLPPEQFREIGHFRPDLPRLPVPGHPRNPSAAQRAIEAWEQYCRSRIINNNQYYRLL